MWIDFFDGLQIVTSMPAGIYMLRGIEVVTHPVGLATQVPIVPYDYGPPIGFLVMQCGGAGYRPRVRGILL